MASHRLFSALPATIVASIAFAGAANAYQAPPPEALIQRTEAALVDQMKCERTPQAALAINAMLKNKLLRYVDNESGVYLFEPTKPLTFLGLPVLHISGFDDVAGFRDAPDSLMVGTAPPVFLEIDVAAPEGELRKRALAAGLTESKRGSGDWPQAGASA